MGRSRLPSAASRRLGSRMASLLARRFTPALCHRRLRLGPSSRLIQRQHPLCLEPSRRHGHRLLQRLDALHWLQRSVSPRQQRHGPVSPRQLRNRRLLPSRHEHHASRQQRQPLRLLPGQLATRPHQLRLRPVPPDHPPPQRRNGSSASNYRGSYNSGAYGGSSSRGSYSSGSFGGGRSSGGSFGGGSHGGGGGGRGRR